LSVMVPFRRGSESAQAALPRHVGYAVRLDWPDGSHSFVTYARSLERVERRRKGLQNCWQRGPVRPVSYQTLVISRHEWKLHARRGHCRAPDCELSGAAEQGSTR
jgi:hypothetical protein